jgi:predicted nucleic acid-binding protein
MSGPGTGPAGLVPDANVLIDYAESDRGVLALIAQYVAAIHIPSPVLAEVRRLSSREAVRLGLEVVEPTLAQATEAARGAGPTSFEDRLCLAVARDNGWACLTNDRALRRACGEWDVRCIWGLEVMGILVHAGHLAAKRAQAIAERIAEGNPYITRALLARFRQRIGA